MNGFIEEEDLIQSNALQICNLQTTSFILLTILKKLLLLFIQDFERFRRSLFPLVGWICFLPLVGEGWDHMID